MKEWKLFIMLVASAFFLAYLAGAATLDVAPGQSIQDAIDKAEAGDTIAIKAGVYYESLNVSKPLAIRGTNETIINSGSRGPGLMLRADGTILNSLKITSSRLTGIQVLSNNNLLENLSISGCLDAVRFDGIKNNSLIFNIINNNTNGVTLYKSDYNIIRNNLIEDNDLGDDKDCGLLLVQSNYNDILENDLANNGDCSIFLRSANNNIIESNNVNENDWYGISLVGFSNKNLIDKNRLGGNKNSAIHLDSARENNITENEARNNGNGIYLSYDSNNNLVALNNLSFNDKAIHLAFRSSNNTLRDNIAFQNDYGICITFSAGWNTIFANRLIDNNYNAYDRGLNNRWDNGMVGNYYSDLGSVFYIPGGNGVDRHPQYA